MVPEEANVEIERGAFGWRWSRKVGWALLILLAALFVFSCYLVIDAALDKNISSLARIFLTVLGAGCLIATIFAGRDVVKGNRLRSLARPAPIAALTLYLIAFISAMTDALSLLEPRPATESEPGAIEAAVNEIRAGMEERRDRSRWQGERTLTDIQGLWGEPGCRSAYRFTVRERELTVEWERRPPGVPPYRMVATITGVESNVVETRGVQPERARGFAATFTLTTGEGRTLTWDDQVGEVPLELRPCSE